MAACTPVIINVTGGLQDQCGFVDEDGEYLDPDKHFSADFGTNAVKKYERHGDWVLPVFPAQRGLIGSPQTPYIFDDRCSWEDAGEKIFEFYKMTVAERERRGELGRKYALEEGYTAEGMAQCFIEGMTEALEEWTPPPSVIMVKAV